MEHVTVGRICNERKVALVECMKDSDLQNIHIKGTCFLLIFLSSGFLQFQIAERVVEASAPCFFCFDESEDPVCLTNCQASYFCIFFHPQFLNVNMTFACLRSPSFDNIASIHDMILLKPFIDGIHRLSIREDCANAMELACDCLLKELQEQQDEYWSCRSRSYLIEIIIALERQCGLVRYDGAVAGTGSFPVVQSSALQNAVLFMESHYMEHLTLSDIANAAHMNVATLTQTAKKELGMTVMAYLMSYRLRMAKKQLAFTSVPIKEVASRCGFQTVQHFSRVFKKHMGQPPAEFRMTAVQKRKEAFA
ncbi:MAG: helix-turn-helix transcriptional regulator [Clostridia bacterium]|nr:helix-turn-helix transcriptional regulator [Clostridia bacterium]